MGFCGIAHNIISIKRITLATSYKTLTPANTLMTIDSYIDIVSFYSSYGFLYFFITQFKNINLFSKMAGRES